MFSLCSQKVKTKSQDTSRRSVRMDFPERCRPGSVNRPLVRLPPPSWAPVRIAGGAIFLAAHGYLGERGQAARRRRPSAGRRARPDTAPHAIMSGVIWSSMNAMRSRSSSLRFFRRCSRNRSGASTDAAHRSPRRGRGAPVAAGRVRPGVRAHLRRSWCVLTSRHDEVYGPVAAGRKYRPCRRAAQADPVP